MWYACQGGKGGVGVSISCFFHIHDMLHKLAYYKKSSDSSFEEEKKLFLFRPNLNMFIDVWDSLDENKDESWHKTDCCNVLSDLAAIFTGL